MIYLSPRDKVSYIYFRQKLSFFKQISMNKLSNSFFLFLRDYYNSNRKASKFSFFEQIENVNLQVGFACSVECYKKSQKILYDLFKCKNIGLCDSIRNVLREMNVHKNCEEKFNQLRNTLSLLLYN